MNHLSYIKNPHSENLNGAVIPQQSKLKKFIIVNDKTLMVFNNSYNLKNLRSNQAIVLKEWTTLYINIVRKKQNFDDVPK